MTGCTDMPHWSARTRQARAEIEADAELTSAAEPDVPLGPRCTYRVGGPAAVLVEVDDERRLDRLAEVVAQTGVATLIVGNGSNLLVADRGFDGLVIVLGPSFAAIELPEVPEEDGSSIVRLGAAALLPIAARATARAGLTGFEWAVGVPGSVGGAVRMNAGGHGADMSDSLLGAEVVDLATGQRRWRDVGELDLGYRRSNLGTAEVVTRADVRLHPGNGGEEARLTEIVRWRREHQPGGANAGSVFANPPGVSAGRLIDAAGLKGHRIGSASVSTKHANFIQVDAGGSADDVARLIDDVIERIEQHTGIRLQPENRLVGFEPLSSRVDRHTADDAATDAAGGTAGDDV